MRLRSFPTWCAFQISVSGELWLIRLKNMPGSSEENRPWRSSGHKVSKEGRQEGPEYQIKDAGPEGLALDGDFRRDPNVERVGKEKGSYHYKVKVDHCASVGSFDIAARSVAGTAATVRAVYERFLALESLRTLGPALKSISTLIAGDPGPAVDPGPSVGPPDLGGGFGGVGGVAVAMVGGGPSMASVLHPNGEGKNPTKS